MFQAIAIHHAREEHVEDFLAFMHRVVAAVGEPPGLIEVTASREARDELLLLEPA
jgi:quinol monooxygenase YgiN